jgi:23S rRNA pseudouridine2605 synthase
MARRQRKPSESHDTPDELRNASRGVRLHKAMADAGVASRRESEALIAEGRVKVNGHVITKMPAWVDPENDRITVDGEHLKRPQKKTAGWGASGGKPGGGGGSGGGGAKTYIMVNKPKRVICTNDDPEGRKRVIDLIDIPIAARLFPVGRLDYDSTGLILLTNDGELTNRLTHPSYEVTKRYFVNVDGRLTEADAEKLRKGLYLAHKGKPSGAGAHLRLAAAAVVKILGHETDRTRGDRTSLSITLKEGQNREVRRIMARLGHKVRKLQRVAIGPVKLKGLALGQWRMLTATEVNMLYKAAGLKRKALKRSGGSSRKKAQDTHKENL